MPKYTVIRAEPTDLAGKFLTLAQLTDFLAECNVAGCDPFVTAVRVEHPLEVWVNGRAHD